MSFAFSSAHRLNPTGQTRRIYVLDTVFELKKISSQDLNNALVWQDSEFACSMTYIALNLQP